MTIKMIVATGANYEIGQGGRLPWGYIEEDMAHFREKTKGNIVVMGRKTYESLPSYPKGLANRDNIVISTCDKPIGVGGVYSYTMERLIHCIKHHYWDRDIWVIGGASIYQQLLPYVDEIHWTLVEGVFPDADTHFDMGFLRDKSVWPKTEVTTLVEDMVTVSIWKRKKNN